MRKNPIILELFERGHARPFAKRKGSRNSTSSHELFKKPSPYSISLGNFLKRFTDQAGSNSVNSRRNEWKGLVDLSEDPTNGLFAPYSLQPRGLPGGRDSKSWKFPAGWLSGWNRASTMATRPVCETFPACVYVDAFANTRARRQNV